MEFFKIKNKFMNNKIFKIDDLCPKLNRETGVFIGRYPVLENEKFVYFIYLTAEESFIGSEDINKFKDFCGEKKKKFSQEKLMYWLNKNKKHIIAIPYLDDYAIIKIIENVWPDSTVDDDYYSELEV